MLLRGIKKKPEWKERKVNASTASSTEQRQFRSGLERVYEKDRKLKEWEVVKKEANKEVTKELSKNIHTILMSRLKKR